jgi:hypothetical protein
MKEHNGKMYRDLDVCVGSTIDEAVDALLKLHAEGKHYCSDFNGVTLYSDEVTLDSAYKDITGKTRDEFKADREKERQELLESERRHKERIPVLASEWIEKGHGILDEKYYDEWDRIVPIRLNDLYQGMELGACLEIVEELNKGCDIKKAIDIIEGQGHSGMSFSLVRAMVKAFCDRGDEFCIATIRRIL